MNEQRSGVWPRYIVFSLISIVILFIFLILILYLLKSHLVYKSGAYSTSTTSVDTGLSGSLSLSLDNSYTFASPLRAKSGGGKIRITVFILEGRGLGISGKTVSIGGESQNGLRITSIQPITDGQGRATFDVSSTTSGTYIIQAAVDGTNITQKANISFD